MKVTTQQKSEKFEPVVLTITLETQRELDALGSFFNDGRIADALDIAFHGVTSPPILWDILKKAGADIHFRQPAIYEFLNGS